MSCGTEVELAGIRRRSRVFEDFTTATHRRAANVLLLPYQVVMRDVQTTIGVLTERVRGEFNEMPGLQLTLPQAAKLWGLAPSDCQHIVHALIGENFLRLTPGGTIVRTER